MSAEPAGTPAQSWPDEPVESLRDALIARDNGLALTADPTPEDALRPAQPQSQESPATDEPALRHKFLLNCGRLVEWLGRQAFNGDPGAKALNIIHSMLRYGSVVLVAELVVIGLAVPIVAVALIIVNVTGTHATCDTLNGIWAWVKDNVVWVSLVNLALGARVGLSLHRRWRRRKHPTPNP